MFISNSPEETRAAGRQYAQNAIRGDVFALIGGLGAGKTQFVKGFVAGLGSNAEVTSPTFVLLHEYEGGRLPIYHFDFYRLKSSQELIGVGYDDSLGDGVVIIEWGDKFPEALPAGAVRVRIEILPEGGRRVRATHQP